MSRFSRYEDKVVVVSGDIRSLNRKIEEKLRSMAVASPQSATTTVASVNGRLIYTTTLIVSVDIPFEGTPIEMAKENGCDKTFIRAEGALMRAGINSLEKLSQCTEKELLHVHDFGKGALEKVKTYLAHKGLHLKEE